MLPRLSRELLRLNLGKGYYSFKDFVVGPAVATDASRSRSYTGGGWFSFCGLYDFWVYGSRAARQRIDYLEGDVIVVAVKRMARNWFGKRIPFFIDNLVFEKSGEAGRSRVERLNVLLKELFMLQIVYNFIMIISFDIFYFFHILDIKSIPFSSSGFSKPNSINLCLV